MFREGKFGVKDVEMTQDEHTVFRNPDGEVGTQDFNERTLFPSEITARWRHRELVKGPGHFALFKEDEVLMV